MEDWEKMNLPNELIQGRELTKQLQRQLHLAVSSSSSSSHEQTQEMLIRGIPTSYDEALSMLKAEPPVGGCPRPSLGGSPMSRGDSDRNLDDGSTPRKREAMQRWTERVRAPTPDDGFSWRKYGEKEILGSKYPRGYYRCIHRNVRGCMATKQVQRSDDDPTVSEITHRGRHTCIDHPATVVRTALPENQTDSNASIHAAPLQIILPKTPSPDYISSVMSNNINFSSTPHFVSPSTSGTNCFSESPARLDGFQVGTPGSELAMTVSAATSRNDSQATQWTELIRLDPSSNLVSPLDDGLSWRKYGQKDILGAKYPRGYYRCTHKHVQGCPATKQVQRSDDDPTVFEITYRGRHTCIDHPATVVPSSTLPENQTDSNASIDDAPLQIGELPVYVSAATSGNNSQATGHQRRLPELKVAYHGRKLDDNEMQRLVEEKWISDEPVASSVDTSISLGLGLYSHTADDQKDLKPLLGIDLRHTRAGYVTNEGSLLSDLKKEENAIVSSAVEKPVAMQKQRAESDFVPMQSSRGAETELFPWIMNKDANPHAVLGKAHSYSSHSESEVGSHYSESEVGSHYSESEVGSHCSESESEDTDEEMKIVASPEYHRRETSESALLQMQNTAEPEVEPFSLKGNEDTASDKVHSYSSEQESEVDSYCSGQEYEVGDKKARIEASLEYNDIIHIPKMKKESSSHATLDDADALIDMLGSGGKQEGRSSEGWGAIKYDSIVDHLIKSIKKSNVEKIGIYGRNEVGKAIVIGALKESAILRNLFDRVICVAVPLNCDMEKVQKEIAGQISSDLTEANAVDMPHSEVNALEGLKFLLILVGVNQHMKLETLRIPKATLPVGSKIVFVTRLGRLCDEIEVDKKICLDDLLLCELFRQNVGEVVYYP